MKNYKIIQGDNIASMRAMPDNSVDAIVTDPPYGLSFMAKRWDYDVPSVETWREAIRVLKPGGHLLAFGGSRTYHRLAVAVEDAGFEIRDQMMWLFGSGFPKSHNVSKAIDKMAGAVQKFAPAPVTPDAQKWDGWGTALKPAHEPIVMARKPFKGTVAANVSEHGTGALNIDGCRVGGDNGRWPANILHDGSEAVAGVFPMTSGDSAGRKPRSSGVVRGYDGGWGVQTFDAVRPDSGSASRYFYCAKASKADRDEGLEARNMHPTVKPTDLMSYLCRLVTPPGGVVLDPFAGSGSTGKAAILEGFGFIGLELEPAYVQIAEARCTHAFAKARAEGVR